MKTAFDYLPKRSTEIEIDESLRNLPSDFIHYLKFYYQNFEEYPLKVPKIFVASSNYYYQVGWESDLDNSILKMEGDYLNGMNTTDELLQYKSNGNEWWDYGYLFIGTTVAHNIFLSVTEDKGIGSIYLIEHEERMDQAYKVADSIFEFFQKLIIKSSEDALIGLGISKENLYKNWGEDFWRVKEDNPS